MSGTARIKNQNQTSEKNITESNEQITNEEYVPEFKLEHTYSSLEEQEESKKTEKTQSIIDGLQQSDEQLKQGFTIKGGFAEIPSDFENYNAFYKNNKTQRNKLENRRKGYKKQAEKASVFGATEDTIPIMDDLKKYRLGKEKAEQKSQTITLESMKSFDFEQKLFFKAYEGKGVLVRAEMKRDTIYNVPEMFEKLSKTDEFLLGCKEKENLYNSNHDEGFITFIAKFEEIKEYRAKLYAEIMQFTVKNGIDVTYENGKITNIQRVGEKKYKEYTGSDSADTNTILGHVTQMKKNLSPSNDIFNSEYAQWRKKLITDNEPVSENNEDDFMNIIDTSVEEAISFSVSEKDLIVDKKLLKNLLSGNEDSDRRLIKSYFKKTNMSNALHDLRAQITRQASDYMLKELKKEKPFAEEALKGNFSELVILYRRMNAIKEIKTLKNKDLGLTDEDIVMFENLSVIIENCAKINHVDLKADYIEHSVRHCSEAEKKNLKADSESAKAELEKIKADRERKIYLGNSLDNMISKVENSETHKTNIIKIIEKKEKEPVVEFTGVFKDGEKHKFNPNTNENAVKLWKKYAYQLKMFDANSDEGYFDKHDGVRLKLTKDAEGAKRKVCRINPYSIFFHEFGHNLAFELAKEINPEEERIHTKEELLEFTGEGTGMKIDYRDVSLLYQSSFKVTGAENEKMLFTLNNMLYHEGNAYIKKLCSESKLSSEEEAFNYARNVITKEVLDDKNNMATADISDIWAGITKSKITPSEAHQESYWKSTPVGIEAFAEFYQAVMVDNSSLDLIKTYFPLSFKIFEEILEKFSKTA